MHDQTAADLDPFADPFGPREEVPALPPSLGPLDVLGTMYQLPTLDAEGKPTAPPAALPGWHVNSPWQIQGWAEWQVVPKLPRRVFGGGVTVHYTFETEAQFMDLLAKADLSQPLPPPDPKLVGVEFEGVRCSATRDDQSGMVAVISAYQLAPDRFGATIFQFSNGNTLTLDKNNLMRFAAVWMPFRQSFFKPH